MRGVAWRLPYWPWLIRIGLSSLSRSSRFVGIMFAGLLLFSRHPADVLLLEVGLGGRLDATNVLERPRLL